jgi:site-specific DNA recombinase
MNRNGTATTLKPIRCAIYTRKSTEEGLEQEFNSLDAQRDSGENYIRSQAGAGWTILPDRYDDGGFTGGNMDRPALKRLLADIDARRIDCVVVYKVDRLSRSLLDFSRMMESFDRHQVAFASVTQQFNTATSMGRLVLNVLLSFAQFEREIISERTRDKIAAARRKGKWVGGHPLLGYDIDPQRFRLVVNESEARQVREIYGLYLEHESLLPVVVELERRDWRTKRWITRKGRERGGRGFTKTSLYELLTNVVYAGNIRHKTEIHRGEHTGIVESETWQRVQMILKRNGRSGGAEVRNRFGAILKGLLHCKACGCAMTPTHSTRNGTKRYRYYVCSSAQKKGWKSCPSKSIPAGEIERHVLDQIRGIGRNREVLAATLHAANAQRHERQERLDSERQRLALEAARWSTEIRELITSAGTHALDSAAITRLAELQERMRTCEERGATLRRDNADLAAPLLNEDDISESLAAFDPVWESLTLWEQGKLVRALVERIDYHGATGTLAIAFHPAGFGILADKIRTREVAA